MNYILLFFGAIILFALVNYLMGLRHKEPITQDFNKNITSKLMFKNLLGIDFNDVVYNPSNLQQSVVSDIDGKWYFGAGQMAMLMKSFTNNTFKTALDDLLVFNGISLSDVKYKGQIEYWEGNGFHIESPPEHQGIRLIVITNENIAHKDTLEFKETDLTNKTHNLKWIDDLKIFDGNEVLKKGESPQNVPLFFNENGDEYILVFISNFKTAQKLIDKIIKNNGEIKTFKKDESVEGWDYLHIGEKFNIGYLKEHSVLRINKDFKKEKTKNKLINPKQLEENLISINEGWNDILITRANGREMFNKTLGNDYWRSAEGHCQEYMIRYEDDDEFNAEDIYYRMDIYYKFISEFEKFYREYQKLNKKIPKKIDNRFFALIESLIGAELTLLKMDESEKEIDLSKVFEISERPNNVKVKDSLIDENKDLVDIDEFTYYKGYLFNGVVDTYYDKENICMSVSFKFGLKHGILENYYENGQLKSKTQYFYDKNINILEKYNEDGTVNND